MSENATEHGKEQKKSYQLVNILYMLVAALIAFSMVNISLLGNINTEMSSKISLKADGSRPANISIIKLSVHGCTDCFDIDSAANALRQYSVKITDEKVVDSSSSDGRLLIEKYGINKVPALVVQGEINKPNVKDLLAQSGELKADAVVYAASKPVYLDTASGRIMGRVNVTTIKDFSCSECVNVSSVLDQIKQYGVSIENEKNLDISDAHSMELVEKYKIEIIPTVLFSSDIEAYSDLLTALRQMGTFEPDGTYILRAVSPPSRNLSTGMIVGRVDMVNIVDESCQTCYNVTVNKQILQSGYGLYISNETTYDIGSAKGAELLSKYNITLVPTFMISPESKAYGKLMQIWKGIGTVEKNGWFVFRNIRAIPNTVYRDLSTNQTVGG